MDGYDGVGFGGSVVGWAVAGNGVAGYVANGLLLTSQWEKRRILLVDGKTYAIVGWNTDAVADSTAVNTEEDCMGRDGRCCRSESKRC